MISSAVSRSVHNGSVPNEVVRDRARIHQEKYHNITAAAAAMALAAVAAAILQRSQRSEQLLVPAANAATLAGNECDCPVCQCSTPELGGLEWFTGFIHHDLGTVVAHCPRLGTTHSVQWVRRAACVRCMLFLSQCMVQWHLQVFRTIEM